MGLSGDCKAIKAKLTDLCREAEREGALVRVACRDLLLIGMSTEGERAPWLERL